jgi:hypothetical protein
MAPFSKFSKEGDTIGRLLAGYSNIELSLFHAVHVATGDFEGAGQAYRLSPRHRAAERPAWPPGH